MKSVEQIESLVQVDAGEWEQLAGQDVLSSYGWLRTVEETHVGQNQLRCFLIRDQSGILAATHGIIEEKGDTGFNLDHVLFGRYASKARSLGLSTLPALVCGARMGLCEPVLVRTGTPHRQRRRLVSQMIQGVQQLAGQEGLTVCFRNVADHHDSVEEILQAHQFRRAPELPMAYLDIRWPTFRDYRLDLKTSHRATEKSIRREASLARRHGVIIEQVTEPAAYRSELHRLLSEHAYRLNRRSFPFGPQFVERLLVNLGERAVVYIARQDDVPIGTAIGLKNDNCVFLTMIGVDERGREAATYFNLGYNQPIRDFTEARFRQIYFGKLLYDVKIRRGCKLLKLNMYLRGRSRLHSSVLRPLLACHARRIKSLATIRPCHGQSGQASAVD